MRTTIKYLCSVWDVPTLSHAHAAAVQKDFEDEIRAATERVAARHQATMWDVEDIPSECLYECPACKTKTNEPGVCEPCRKTGDEHAVKSLSPIARPGDVERPERIHIDARRFFGDQARPTRYARCGNCGDRMPITDDPTENHHLAMRHKENCRRASEAADQHLRLKNEFECQPHVIHLRKLAELAAAPEPPPAPDKWKERRPRWWEFWKW